MEKEIILVFLLIIIALSLVCLIFSIKKFINKQFLAGIVLLVVFFGIYAMLFFLFLYFFTGGIFRVK